MANWQLSCNVKLFSISLLFSLSTVLALDPQGGDLEGSTMSTSTGSTLINTIYQFGDSISDTGNWIREDPSGLCSGFPYGESYFHFASGRCSDGLIMLDYYAMAFGLEFLNPYLERGANFSSGVNFAVGGSTALNVSFLASKNVTVPGTNSSLSVQLGWFRDYLSSTCSSATECESKLETSLVLMEAIGGGDYSLAYAQHFPSLDPAYELVPYVVQEIIHVVKVIIQLGVVNVVVPSVFPIGCLPYILTDISSPRPEMYDDLGCLIDANKLSEYHGRKLQKAVQKLQMRYPNVTLIYADYYFAYTSLLRIATSLGFDKETTLKTCCGYGENPYNFNSSTLCGTVGVPVCPHPEKSVVWDGYHCTQHFYMYLSDWMLKNTIIPGLRNAFSF